MFISGGNMRPIALALMAGIAALPGFTAAQGTTPYPRADRLATIVSAAATATGDTITVTHSLYNKAPSVLKAHLFVLRTNIQPVSHTGPTTNPYWYKSSSTFEDSAALVWVTTSPKGDVAPDSSAAGFSHVAVGVLGIVRYHVQGYVPSPISDPEFPDTLAAPLGFWQDSYKEWTIAVEPFPSDMSPLPLAERIVSLVSTACALEWVTDNQTCTGQNADHLLALQAVQAGNLATACTKMLNFVNSVDGLPNNKINSEARGVLRLNGLHFRRRHCP